MNPDAPNLWRAPRWALAALLSLLGMLGPFAVDTYIPAFAGIAASLQATPVQMQQTLSGYLFGFAFMSLFHGAISDSFGRRPVVLWGVAVLLVFPAQHWRHHDGCLAQRPAGWQMFVGSSANGIVAGVVAPLVMHASLALAGASLAMLCIGLLAWVYLLWRWPGIGRTAARW